MNKKALEILEYNRIIEMLVNETGSELSAEMAGKLEPSADPREISENLRSTTEAVDLIVHKGPLPTAGVRDIRRPVSLARKGGTLSMKELLEVKQDLKIAERTKTFMKGDLPELPRIRALTDLLVPHEKLAGEIERCILTEDEMADNASRELSRIRRSIVLFLRLCNMLDKYPIRLSQPDADALDQPDHHQFLENLDRLCRPDLQHPAHLGIGKIDVHPPIFIRPVVHN